MRSLGTGFALLIVGGIVAASGIAQAQPVQGPRKQSHVLRQALDELDEAIQAIQGIKHSRLQARALRRALAARALMIEGLQGSHDEKCAHARPHDGPPPMVQSGPSPMEAGRFSDLLRRLGELSFSKDQMAYLDDVARGYRFTTEQVRQVMRVFSFDSDKVKAAVSLYPVVIDKADFYRAQDELTFESDRERLRAEVRRIDATGLPRGREGR